MPRFASLLFASLIVAACSSDDSTSTPNPNTPTKEQVEALAGKYCDGVEMRTEPCFDEDDRKEAAECTSKQGLCLAYAFRPGVIDALVDCNKDAVYSLDDMGNCTGNEKTGDYCDFTVANALPANPAYDAYAKKCYAKFSECGTGPGSFSNDNCDERMKLLDDRVYDLFAECLSKPCEENVITSCMLDKARAYMKEVGAPDFCPIQ